MPATSMARRAVKIARAAARLVLRGQVQGLGVRPAIFRLAVELELAGTVRNTAAGVEVFIEGSAAAIAAFSRRLRPELPTEAKVESISLEPAAPRGCQEFAIEAESAAEPPGVLVPPDRAVCDDCLRECRDAHDRRHRYGFASCTRCGPRYSIIRSLPYERAETTMAAFPLCAACEREFCTPGDRRFHAQTNACPVCGPRIWFVDPAGRTCAVAEGALPAALDLLRSGRILALRGVGGYQLLADAGDEQAVRRLRERKGRAAKPLAVMVASLTDAGCIAHLNDDERRALCGPANPIVLVRARQSDAIASGVHPGIDTIGLMLPSTPLHALLAFDFGGPLVCTSGNAEGEPLEFEVEAAEQRLAGMYDGWLHHDRPIARPIDDSVVRLIAGRPVTIRLARGLAPLHLPIDVAQPTLALGGHMKCAAAWSNGRQAVLGPHVGDQDSLAARQRLFEQIDAWQELYRFQPEFVAHDLHPDFATTRLAVELGRESLAVQHHHAHVLAAMIEHGWLDRSVQGVAWDGTGYGPDGTIWGGEFLISTTRGFDRIAALRPFRLPGGEHAVRQPWRTALAVLKDAVGIQAAMRAVPPDLTTYQAAAVVPLLDAPSLSPRTTSAGRLFDAAASVILGVRGVDHEGQAAMMLESVADGSADGSYPLPLVESALLQLDWRPLFVDLLRDRRVGVCPSVMAARFHRALAGGIVSVCRRRLDLPVVLCGGVFQNRLLTEMILEMWQSTIRLGLPGVIPPGDGGLAAGQLAAAISL